MRDSDYTATTIKISFPTGIRTRREKMLASDRQDQRMEGRAHDCMIGISGGVDGSYVAYLAKEKFGLRPLLYHVDAG
jgi:tRNA(Ile)-lysidine synthase TilS/MesJ